MACLWMEAVKGAAILRECVHMRAFLKNLAKDEKGLETVEYAIIAGLIVVATITTITSIGTKVASVFTKLDSKMPT